jgi:hypothetical protein
MFLTDKEDIVLLNNYLALYPDCSCFLADALIYCWKYYPEKYNELIEKYGNGEVSMVINNDNKND